MHDPREDGVLMIGDYPFKFDANEFSDFHKEIATRELRETPEVKSEAIVKLRELLKGAEDFNFPFAGNEGDDILLQFLRPCKFYPESAFDLMKRYFGFLFNNPKLGQNLVNKDDQNIYDTGVVSLVPVRDQHGRCIVLLEVGSKWDTAKCKVHEIFRGMIMLIQAAMTAPHNQVAGGVVIIDAKGLGLTHVAQFTPGLVLTITNFVQECLPFRLKAIHVVNQGHFFSLVFALFKPLLSKKLQKRVHFHGADRESLLKHMDAKAVPAVYGGELVYPDVPGSQVFKFLSYYKGSFDKMDKCAYTQKPK